MGEFARPFDVTRLKFTTARPRPDKATAMLYRRFRPQTSVEAHERMIEVMESYHRNMIAAASEGLGGQKAEWYISLGMMGDGTLDYQDQRQARRDFKTVSRAYNADWHFWDATLGLRRRGRNAALI